MWYQVEISIEILGIYFITLFQEYLHQKCTLTFRFADFITSQKEQASEMNECILLNVTFSPLSTGFMAHHLRLLHFWNINEIHSLHQRDTSFEDVVYSFSLQQRNIGNMRILNGIGWIKYKRKVIVQNIISYSIKYFLITCNLISQTCFSLESVLLTKKFFLFDFSFVRDNNSTNLFACRVNIVDEKLLVSITVLWWE